MSRQENNSGSVPAILSGRKSDTRIAPPVCATLLGTALAFVLQASHAERADRDQPMRMEANQVSIDDARQISTFSGNVQLTQGTLSIQADTLVLVEEPDGSKFGTATGKPASFRQKREGSEEVVEGHGERITYSTRSETIDLSGQARMKRGQDEVSGELITYNSRTEVFQARTLPGPAPDKARVRVIIQPRNEPAARASTSPADAPLPTPQSPGSP